MCLLVMFFCIYDKLFFTLIVKVLGLIRGNDDDVWNISLDLIWVCFYVLKYLIFKCNEFIYILNCTEVFLKKKHVSKCICFLLI